jgi:hypothetical protein
MNSVGRANKSTLIGLGMVTLATLMYENLLTRIFSVTMWYHFAFLAISIALFGMTVGAIIVYLLPGFFAIQNLKFHLAATSILFSISTVISTIVHAKFRLVFDISFIGLLSILLNYIVISLPFVFSGICVSLALTRFPDNISELYAADLLGAALGCLAFVYTLKITDAMTAVLVVAAIASLGALFFSIGAPATRFGRLPLIYGGLLITFSMGNTFLAHQQESLLRLKWVKGRLEPQPLFEKWNSFSRIAVWGNMNKTEEPYGWGISDSYPSDEEVRQLHLNIDANAETVMTEFNGDVDQVDYLKYDLINMAHFLRPDSSVLVIGSGGGRDILSALAFGQKSVLAVEINEDINKALNQEFGDFTGHLDQIPKVRFINDEARSYISGSAAKFDIIQGSLIDTWAATASGAYVLSENSIYTVEAWNIFLHHLTSRGILTFTRWYVPDNPAEIYRLTSLASVSLRQFGVQDPRKHIILMRNIESSWLGEGDVGIGTILVSPEPFSKADLKFVEDIAESLHFELMLTPESSADQNLGSLASGKLDFEKNSQLSIMNLDAPTDNSPFFFLTIRLKDIFKKEVWQQGMASQNMVPVYILGAVLIVVVALSFLCIVVPLILTARQTDLKSSLPLFIFFIAIGLGFMMVEISQMQRLIIFLGHPTYGLSVVLFSLLLSSGAGSAFTQRIMKPESKTPPALFLFLLLIVILAFGLLTPYSINLFEGSETFIRILVSAGILMPIGFFMGMPFPIGMGLATTKSPLVTPWLWGINGAMSVCASVLAIIIALSDGISTAFWAGAASYGIAWLSILWIRRENG